jgi:hypothetical protein
MKVMLYEIIFMSNSQDPFSSLLFHQTVYLKCVQTYFYLGEFEREIGRARDMRGRWEVGREEGGRRENAYTVSTMLKLHYIKHGKLC